MEELAKTNRKNIFKKLLISLGIIIVAIIAIYFTSLNNIIDRSTFIIKITGDYTSSGAQRNYYATLVFVDNKLVEGSETYFVGQGGGCTNDCERINSCKVINGEWIDESGATNCQLDYPFIPSITKEGLEKQIESNELKPLDTCGHLDTFYEILDISHIDDGKPGQPGGSMGNQSN